MPLVLSKLPANGLHVAGHARLSFEPSPKAGRRADRREPLPVGLRYDVVGAQVGDSGRPRGALRMEYPPEACPLLARDWQALHIGHPTRRSRSRVPRTSRWPSGRHQITDMVATTFDNRMRPVWLLFEGGATCSRLCPSTSTWPTTFSPSLWANERMTLEFADMLVAY